MDQKRQSEHDAEILRYSVNEIIHLVQVINFKNLKIAIFRTTYIIFKIERTLFSHTDSEFLFHKKTQSHLHDEAFWSKHPPSREKEKSRNIF